MVDVRRLKRLRVEVEINSVSKYFKKEEEATLKDLESFTSDEQVDFDKVRGMKSKEFFDYIDNRTFDGISDNFTTKNCDAFPKNFVSIYSKVRLMRSKIVTPVDTVGCAMMPINISAKFGIEKYDIRPQIYRLQLLVSLMMSSQTKDEMNAKALYNLMKYSIETMKSTEGVTLDVLLNIEQSVLETLIHPVGFHRKKSRYIKEAAQLLLNNFGGDVPTSIEGFCSLPGVGPKMGYLALQKSWGIVAGIGVDVHVDRLSKMWRWVDSKKCKTPEHTRKALESWLPRDLWYEFNPVLVGFGQVICSARGRRCDICLANTICDNVDRKLVNSSKLDVNEILSRGDHSKLLLHLQELQNETEG
ncbi:HBL060Wp [Eremothecium sinecaudum]|uniref:Endonuclease III homolog n=1 Tax=Eremothecium sinecaudum TaxID=45286 RepID=A0A120K0Z3_9SACH|nr:HBL060Wp [Eremothecium sinecaudum]AMD18842.1 HBL060Wp [Eremothecium sinecaudum]